LSSAFFIRLVRLALVLSLQIMICNHIHLWGYATPLILSFMIIRFERDASRIGLLIWGFCMGLIFDTYANTAGMASAACTLLAMIQPKLLQVFLPRDAEEGYKPSIANMGVWKYMLYALLANIVVHSAFYALDAFTLHNWQLTLISIGSSSLLSTALCIAMELIATDR